MNEMNIPYLNPYMDMSEMNTPFENSFERKAVPATKMALAMAYVPDQPWETPYEVLEGLDRGTLFPSLDKPFLGGGKRL